MIDIELLKFFFIPLLSFIFGIIITIFIYRNKSTRKIKIVTKLFELESEKFREIIKNDYNITKLELVDEKGKRVKPYPLKEGRNHFKCIATYTDGTKDEYNPYWLCWLKDGGNGREVFGESRLKSVTIACYPNHERYSELSCWVFPPKGTESNSNIPHDSIGFIYPKSCR